VSDILTSRLVELVGRLKAELSALHQRIDGSLDTAEKASLPGAINELVRKKIAVGTTPPTSPYPNDLWVDTN
jgi:hypothetical protein